MADVGHLYNERRRDEGLFTSIRRRDWSCASKNPDCFSSRFAYSGVVVRRNEPCRTAPLKERHTLCLERSRGLFLFPAGRASTPPTALQTCEKRTVVARGYQ
jgi:hypothetical protein